MANQDTNGLPEADRAPGCPHPREVYAIIGHKNAEQQIAKQINEEHLHHAWLISGAGGIGKATLAYRMIRRVLGGKPATSMLLDVPKDDPTAQRVESLGHGDFLLIRRPYDIKTKKLRSEIPVAEARKINTFFSRKSAEGGWRVCLIDSMDEMNRHAANAVLKILEEPPQKALIILISQAPGRLLATIRSRCMNLKLRPVDPSELKPWLADKTQAAPDHIKAAIQLSGGAPGRALELARNAESILEPLAEFITSFPRPNQALLHQIAENLSAHNAHIQYDLFYDVLGNVLRSQALYAATGEWEGAYQPIASSKTAGEWIDTRDQINQAKLAQSALNMNKKAVLLNTLQSIAGSL